MAIIDIGTFTDQDHDQGTTTRLSVPDEGELPVFAEGNLEIPFCEVGVGSSYGLGLHSWIRVYLEIDNFDQRTLFIFFVAARMEWICFECRSSLAPYGRHYYEHTFRGPYRLTQSLMTVVLDAYYVSRLIVPTEELRHCHPDIFGDLVDENNT